MAYAADSPNAIGTTVPPFGGSGGGAVTLAGDVTGPALANTISALQGTPVNAAAPAPNDVLTFDGATWVPAAVGAIVGALGGDLSGTLPNPTVVGIQTTPVTAGAVNGDFLLMAGGAWTHPVFTTEVQNAVSLQTAYVTGNSINVVAAEGSVTLSATTNGDATPLLTLTRNHLTGATGSLIVGTMHTAATGNGVLLNQATASATARALNIDGSTHNNACLRVQNASGTLDIYGRQIDLAVGSSWILTLAGVTKLAVNAAGITVQNSALSVPNGSAGTAGLNFAVGADTGMFALSAPNRALITGGGAQAASFDGSDNSAAGTVDGTLITFVVNQSGTAAYTGFRVQVTETAVGSGTKRLAAFGTTAAGVLLAIDNTGRIQAPDGTNAAPAHSFLSDPGNGMYLSAADTLGFAVNGTLQFSISTTQAILVAGQYIAPNGNTPGAPQYAWASSQSMGMYRASSTSIGFSTASTLRLTISSTAVTVEAAITLACTLIDINNADALGGGAGATLGTIGGTGPTVAAQNQWLQIAIGGVNHWVPVWV